MSARKARASQKAQPPKDQSAELAAVSPTDLDRADDIRTFLSSVTVLRGCGWNDEHFDARGYCEKMALAFESKTRPMPTPVECIAILNLLTFLEPKDDTHCYGHSGDNEQCGLNAILDGIALVIGGMVKTQEAVS